LSTRGTTKARASDAPALQILGDVSDREAGRYRAVQIVLQPQLTSSLTDTRLRIFGADALQKKLRQSALRNIPLLIELAYGAAKKPAGIMAETRHREESERGLPERGSLELLRPLCLVTAHNARSPTNAGRTRSGKS